MGAGLAKSSLTLNFIEPRLAESMVQEVRPKYVQTAPSYRVTEAAMPWLISTVKTWSKSGSDVTISLST